MESAHQDCYELERQLKQRINMLEKLLRESKREHINTFNGTRGFYCQTYVTDTVTGLSGPCTCGAATWNAKVDEALKS